MILYVIEGQDLKVIKCTGRAKFVNEVLFSDQCIHRLLILVLLGLVCCITSHVNV